MHEPEPIKVLAVDDLPERLLVYRAVLEEQGVEIVAAHSGAEALRRVLVDEFAVILLDVNMPGMDGFETASLIRARRRSAHTPIIFVTAHADELHTLRGYAHGAVDYILSPIVPDILRTKVRVFVQLFRLTQQVKRRAALDVAHARSEQARLAAVLENASDFVAHADADGALTGLNAAGRRLLGLGSDDHLPPDVLSLCSPSAADILRHQGLPAALQEGVWIGESSLRTSAGADVPVAQVILAHRGASGAVESLSLIARDVSERKRTERALRDSERRLRAMFGQAAVGISLIDPVGDGRLLEVNGRLCQIVGRAPGELLSMTCADLTHPDEWPHNRAMMDDVVAGRRAEFTVEKRYRRHDGTWVWVNSTVSPMTDETGRVYRLVSVIEDASARKAAEEEVSRHRERLEDLVRERTAELEASHERLRLADRLASIGTLAAGLGHDMGNLLLPVRMRLDALERMGLPPAAAEDLHAIRDACEYLNRLSHGLRLFSLSPDDRSASGARCDLNVWWANVAPFLRNILPRGVTLGVRIPAILPDALIPPHVLTQAVYNLVQNAADVMRARGHGVVSISVAAHPDLTTLAVEVSDDGPGMSPQVLERCMEPFFTTKPRGISTGLGLAIVRGAVNKCGGSVDIRSRPGEGATFRLTLPCAPAPGTDTTDASMARPRAFIAVGDPRRRAYLDALFGSLGVAPAASPIDEDGALVIVADRAGGRLDDLPTMLNGGAGRAIVLDDAPPDDVPVERVTVLSARCDTLTLRRAVIDAIRAQSGSMQEVVT